MGGPGVGTQASASLRGSLKRHDVLGSVSAEYRPPGGAPTPPQLLQLAPPDAATQPTDEGTGAQEVLVPAEVPSTLRVPLAVPGSSSLDLTRLGSWAWDCCPGHLLHEPMVWVSRL